MHNYYTNLLPKNLCSTKENAFSLHYILGSIQQAGTLKWKLKELLTMFSIDFLVVSVVWNMSRNALFQRLGVDIIDQGPKLVRLSVVTNKCNDYCRSAKGYRRPISLLSKLLSLISHKTTSSVGLYSQKLLLLFSEASVAGVKRIFSSPFFFNFPR